MFGKGTRSVKNENRQSRKPKMMNENAQLDELEMMISDIYADIYASLESQPVDLNSGMVSSKFKVTIPSGLVDGLEDCDLLDQDFECMGVFGDIICHVDPRGNMKFKDSGNQYIIDARVAPNGRGTASAKVNLKGFKVTFNDVVERR